MKLTIISENTIECSHPIIGHSGELGRESPFIRLKITEDGELKHFKVYVTDISYAKMIYNKVHGNKFPYKNTLAYIKQLEHNGAAKMVKLLNKQEELWPRVKGPHRLQLPPYA